MPIRFDLLRNQRTTVGIASNCADFEYNTNYELYAGFIVPLENYQSPKEYLVLQVDSNRDLRWVFLIVINIDILQGNPVTKVRLDVIYAIDWALRKMNVFAESYAAV